MLPHGAEAQAEPRAEQHHVDDHQEDERHVDDHVLLEQDLAEKWQLVQAGDVDVRQQLALGGMADVLDAVDAVDQEDGHAGGEDVDRDSAHDLVGTELDRDDRVDGGHQAPGEHRHRCGEPHVVQGEVGDDAEEGAGQHHAFHRDVDDTAAFRDHATEGGQQEQHGGGERRLPQVGGDEQVEDVAERCHVVSGGGAAASVISGAAGGASAGTAAGGPPPRPGIKRPIWPTKLAAMLKRISAWRMKTRLPDIPASACITAPPACKAPKRIAASTIPTALPSPRSATAMASKPVVSEKKMSVRLWSTPAICTAPASPENAPAMSIVTMMVRRTLTPA